MTGTEGTTGTEDMTTGDTTGAAEIITTGVEVTRTAGKKYKAFSIGPRRNTSHSLFNHRLSIVSARLARLQEAIAHNRDVSAEIIELVTEGRRHFHFADFLFDLHEPLDHLLPVSRP